MAPQWRDIFTDDSILENSEYFYCRKIISSTTAELPAKENAIRFAEGRNFDRDPKAGLQDLVQKPTRNYIVANVLNKIQNAEFLKLELHYIPGRSEILGNTKVDQMAPRYGTEVEVKWIMH